MAHPFAERPALCGPLRQPRQMLADQTYDGHKSVHDDAVAEGLGLRAGPIEGPTHFSQFVPVCEKIWGQAFFETGCLSAHFRNPAFADEELQASVERPQAGRTITAIGMTRRDGTEILRGTASVGTDVTDTALEQRLKELKPLADPVILADVKVGMTTARQSVRMDFDQNMGDLYPFSLAAKLKKDFPRSLDRAPFLLPTERSASRRALDEWFEKHRITPTVVAEFDDSALTKTFAQQGAGVFAAPAAIAR